MFIGLNDEVAAELVTRKVPADAATAYGLIYRHTRQAPSSHWAGQN
jgi:hypothetical protein